MSIHDQPGDPRAEGPKSDDARFDDLFAVSPSPTPLDPPSATLGAPATPLTADAQSFASAPGLSSLETTTSIADAFTLRSDAQSSPEPQGRRLSRASRRSQSSALEPVIVTGPVAGTPKKPASALTVRMVPAASSFDLLEGAYAKIRRSRLILEVLIGTTLVLSLVLAGLGIAANGHTAQLRSQTSSVLAATNSATQQYDKYSTSSVSGQSLLTIDDHVTQRLTYLKTATTTQVNVLQVVNDIVSQFQALGAKVSTLSINASGSSYTLGVSVTASSGAVIYQVINTAQSIKYLSAVTSTGTTGSATQATTTITGTLSIATNGSPSVVMPLPAGLAINAPSTGGA
jgi:hypothetical protein